MLIGPADSNASKAHKRHSGCLRLLPAAQGEGEESLWTGPHERDRVSINIWAKQCDGAQPICNRCLARGALKPCHYNKLHHIRLLREQISQLESELSRTKEESSRAPESKESARPLWSDSHGVANRHEMQPLRECSSRTNSSVCIKTECSAHSQHTASAELIDHLLAEHSLSGAINRSFYSPEIQEVQLSNSRKPDHLISSIWLEAEQVPGVHLEWVNRTFWEMRAKGRWLAKQGLEVSAIMGDTCPSLHPDPRSGEDDAVNFWTVSRWAARFVDKFLDISHSDRLACWIVIFVTFQVCRPVLVQAILLD